MTLRFLRSTENKSKDKPPSHDKLEDLIKEACPDILWTIKGVKAEDLPSL